MESTAHGRRRTAAPPEDQPRDATELGARRAAPDAAPMPDGQTQLGRRRPMAPPQAAEGVVRFGSGTAPDPGWAQPPRKRRRSRRWPALDIVVLLLVGVALWLFLRPDPFQARATAVAPATPPGTACDVTVDIVGTITTNGAGGTVRYQWERSDGQPSAVLTQAVESGATTTEVHLLWTLSGRGTYDARATLHVLEQPPSDAVGGFTYRCP